MEEIKQYMQDTDQKLRDTWTLVNELLVKYSFDVLGAVIILVIGFWIASQVAAMLARLLTRKGVDITLTKFGAGAVKLVIIIFVVIMALDKLGITMTPFVAALSGAVFGASFAFQGPLMNYGAGLTIIMTRPFVVGDTITVAGCSGLVEEINLALTALRNEDGVRITIPNRHIVGEIVYNSKMFKMADQKIGISYSADTKQTSELVLKVLAGIPDVAQDPKPQVGIAEFGESSVQLSVRYWAPTKKYYQTMFTVNQAVYEAIRTAGVTIPFPQREVRIVGGKI